MLVLSIGLVSWLRSYYIDSIRILFPQLETGSLWAAISMGILLFIVVSVINILAVKGKCFRFGCTNHRCRIKHITYENKTTFSIHRGLIAFFSEYCSVLPHCQGKTYKIQLLRILIYWKKSHRRNSTYIWTSPFMGQEKNMVQGISGKLCYTSR